MLARSFVLPMMWSNLPLARLCSCSTIGESIAAAAGTSGAAVSISGFGLVAGVATAAGEGTVLGWSELGVGSAAIAAPLVNSNRITPANATTRSRSIAYSPGLPRVIILIDTQPLELRFR